MKTRYEIHKGQFDGCQKIQYYIWDTKTKHTVVNILHGGIRAAKAIRKVLTIIILALILAGCSSTTGTYKDGVATITRWRLLMTEDIDSFSYDARDGSFTLDGYRSDMTRMIDLVDRLTKKDESITIGGKEVKP